MATTEIIASENPNGDQRLLISADTLSHLLGISTRTIWRRLNCGDIPKPVRLGKSVRWRLSEIKSWIDRR